MNNSLESELANLLNDLLAVQEELLATLVSKRELLMARDTEGLAAIGLREEKLMGDLTECLKRREALPGEARQQGLPSGSIRSLAEAIPRGERGELHDRVRRASSQARLLRHHSLTNWVFVQRTLIHLSQMLEIIATGGQLQPTYGEGQSSGASGAMVDHAA
jgi:hypothetical protein